MNISKHVSYKEATYSQTALNNNIDNTPSENQLIRIQRTAEAIFEPLREWVNEPIKINSVFRSSELNKRIGGANSSQHLANNGSAFDIDDILCKKTNKEMFFYILNNLEFDQLIWEFGNDENLRNNLVAAYLIGYTVTDEDLAMAKLECAEGEADTGVVITYNTQSPTSVGGPMLMEGAHCINPLNWKTDDTYASSSENKGARFYIDATGEFVKEINKYSDAQINLETGALMTNIPEGEELEIGAYPEGVYHRYDYAIWYRNLEENVAVRIDAYLNK